VEPWDAGCELAELSYSGWDWGSRWDWDISFSLCQCVFLKKNLCADKCGWGTGKRVVVPNTRVCLCWIISINIKNERDRPVLVLQMPLEKRNAQTATRRTDRTPYHC
jgi:hypothetical protein